MNDFFGTIWVDIQYLKKLPAHQESTLWNRFGKTYGENQI
jgi:hypothetical protein